MKDKIFFGIGFGFLVGVLVRSFFIFNTFYILLFGVISLGLLVFFALVVKFKWGVVWSVFLLSLVLGSLRFDLADKNISLGKVEGDFSGLIVAEPDVREGNQKLTVLVSEGEIQTKVLVTVGLEGRFEYGDYIKFSGKLEEPENFITDQGKVFDYVNYLHKDGIRYISFYPNVEILEKGGGGFVRRNLFIAKNFLLEKISSSIPMPESLLLGGLILGERGAFSQDLRENLVTTGTIHIVALSGYNVTIVSEWIMRVLYFLPGVWAFGAGILGIVLFVIMAGAGSTAVRAGTMAVLALVARATGRTYAVARAMLVAGVLMVVFNPLVLRYDVSFQLSFLATIAVVFFAPKMQKYFLWVTDKWKLRDVVSVTFSVYIFVLPFILYKMGNLSLVALPANILILPFIPATMMFGFFTAIVGAIADILATPFSLISYALLKYELLVVDFFARVPLASLDIPNFPLTLTLLIYAGIVYKIFGRQIKNFMTAPL